MSGEDGSHLLRVSTFFAEIAEFAIFDKYTLFNV